MLKKFKTKDGKEFLGERAYPIGSPEEPLDMEMFRTLYSKFCAGVLSSEQIDQTVDTILTLEKQNDVLEFMDILTFKHNVI